MIFPNQELGLLLVLVAVAILTYSSLVYFAGHHHHWHHCHNFLQCHHQNHQHHLHQKFHHYHHIHHDQYDHKHIHYINIIKSPHLLLNTSQTSNIFILMFSFPEKDPDRIGLICNTTRWSYKIIYFERSNHIVLSQDCTFSLVEDKLNLMLQRSNNPCWDGSLLLLDFHWVFLVCLLACNLYSSIVFVCLLLCNLYSSIVFVCLLLCNSYSSVALLKILSFSVFFLKNSLVESKNTSIQR